MLSLRLLQNFLLGFLIVVLGLGLWWAGTAGIRAGKSSVILKNTATIQTGLSHFFQDQNRYPTAVEFQDRDIMGNYFSFFPPQAITGGSCTQTYNYLNQTARSYVLNFCLPRAKSGFASGWNKLESQ